MKVVLCLLTIILLSSSIEVAAYLNPSTVTLSTKSQTLQNGWLISFVRGPLAVCNRQKGLFRSTITMTASSAAEAESSKIVLKYGGLQHAGVLVSDTENAVRFYTEILGMTDVSYLRPPLEYPGAFIACGTHQIHLMQLPSPDPREGRPVHGGRDRHIAVTIADLDPLSRRLTEHGIPFTMSKSGRRALFCRDRDSNAIEFVEDTSI